MSEQRTEAEFVEPELRDGPPWVMQEMIAAQLELPARIAAAPSTAALRELLRGAIERDEQIVFTGCGTSEHAARAAAAILLSTAPRATVSARDAFEVRLRAPTRGVLVAISHDAGTRATLEAASRAASLGARVALITANPQRLPAGPMPIATPAQDRSWCHTIGYTSPLLAVAMALEAITPSDAQATIAAELEYRPVREASARGVADCARLLIVGSGVDEITAAELALKVEEAAYSPSTPLGAEKVLHGHLPAADEHTGLVLLRFDPSSGHDRDLRARSVLDATRELAMPALEMRPVTQPGSVTEALLAGAVALQLTALELAHARHTNPDLIRRHDERYRRAAQAAGAG